MLRFLSLKKEKEIVKSKLNKIFTLVQFTQYYTWKNKVDIDEFKFSFYEYHYSQMLCFRIIVFSKEFDIFYKLKDLMQCRVKSVVSFQADGFFPFIWWTCFVIPLVFAKILSDTFAKFPRFFLYDWRKSSFCLKPSLHQKLITSFCGRQKSI